MKIAVVSDTHLQSYQLSQQVAVLIHAGDHTFHGDLPELNKAIEQLAEHKSHAQHIIAIAGNHDRICEQDPALVKRLFAEKGIVYLQDALVSIDGISIYGSPWTPEFCGWAFPTGPLGTSPEDVWGKIPEGYVDILVTHGPPWGRFDTPCGSNNHVGCASLMRHVQRVKPRVHAFGHIHSPGDVIGADGIRYINAAVCNGLYDRVYEPAYFDIEPKPSQVSYY